MAQRTTLTLQDDVYAALRRESHRTSRPLHDVVDTALRRGLARQTAARPKIVLQTFSGDLLVDVTSASAVLELIEGPGHR